MAWGIKGIIGSVKTIIDNIETARNPEPIRAAEEAVHTAATNVRQNGTPAHQQAYIDSLYSLVDLAGQDVRKTVLDSADARPAVEAQINAIKADYQGPDDEKAILFPLLDELQTQILAETPEQRQLQVDIYEARQDVTAAQSEVQGAAASLNGFGSVTATNIRVADARIEAQHNLDGKIAAYSVAASNLLGLELDDEISSIPAGADGSHTADQWTQAAANLKQRYGVPGEVAALIDALAVNKGNAERVQVYLDRINDDPGSLNLTDAEQALADKNPINLAFLKAAGITLDRSDPGLTRQMSDIAEDDPVLFGMLQLGGATIETDGTPPADGSQDGLLSSGEYLYVTIGGNPYPVSDKLVQQFELGGPVALGTVLLEELHLESNPIFTSLASGTDIVRSEYVTGRMQELMGGANPDTEAAIALLGRELPEFFSADTRQVTWEMSGLPFLEPVLHEELEAIRFDGDDETSVLTYVADYMTETLHGAPPEVASLLLGMVPGHIDRQVDAAVEYGTMFSGPNYALYSALSSAVQLADQLPGSAPTAQQPEQHAERIAEWLLQPSEATFFDSDTPYVLGEEIRNTENMYLPDALVVAARKREDEYDGYVDEMEEMVASGKQDLASEALAEINKQSFLQFNEDPSRVLNPYFDGFLSDPHIGHPVTVTDETELRNLVGKTLGLPAANRDAAQALDYGEEWYAPDTAEWNMITTVTDWIHDEGGDDPRINALPIKYASERDGVSSGGLFIVTTEDGGETLIDGTAAVSTVAMNGGAPIDPDNVQVNWSYDSFQEFQEDNYYDDHGKVYLPSDFRLADTNNDGHADYKEQDAAIITTTERVKMGLGYAGAAATFMLFIPALQPAGGALLAVTAILGVGSSIDQLQSMSDHNQSLSWSNPAARAEYMNLAGSAAGLGRVGFLKFGANATLAGAATRASWFDRGAKLTGFVASYSGFQQTLTQALYLATNWGQMTGSQRGHAVMLLTSGVAQMGLGAMDLKPMSARRIDLRPQASTSPEGQPATLNELISQRAYGLWEQAGRPEGQADAHWTQAWESVRHETVSQRAYQIWQEAGEPPNQRSVHWGQANREFETQIGQRAYSIWEEAGRPYGEHQAHWAQAEYEFYEAVLLSPSSARVPYTEQFARWVSELPSRAREYLNGKGEEWSNRRANPSPPYRAGWRQFIDYSKVVVRQVGKGYLFVNGMGLAGEAVYYLGFQESRTSGAITNAEGEMRELLADPDGYLDENYDNAFFGIEFGDWGYNFNGHLLTFTPPGDDNAVYFRRVPQDLYDAYKEALEARGASISDGIDETVYLEDTPGFNPEDAGPLAAHVAQAQDEFSEQLGEHGYQLWVDADKPGGGAAAAYWLLLEANFNNQKGALAFDIWEQAGRPSNGSNSVWIRATADLQTEIDNRATALWRADGGQGSGPSQAHVAKTEREFRDDIGLRAFDLWVDDQRPAGGAAADHWTQAEEAFATERAASAYELWSDAGKPDGTGDEYWTEAVDELGPDLNERARELWEGDRKPYEIDVELRPPYRMEPFRDATVSSNWDRTEDGVFGFRWRPSFAFGPVEGWRPHIDGEITLNYRYNQPNVSTVRVGAPSPTTNGWGVGIRQQDTTIWSQLRASAGAIDYNKARVRDLTNPSPFYNGNQFTAMEARAYVALGNRNRLRVDYGGGNGYIRARETGFMELGLGIDFLKYAYGDETISLNGYYEVQLYMPDLRAQWNFYGNGAYTRGLQGMPPWFEIDPAVQFSSTEPIRIADLPILSSEKR